ncbi:hypothetical protein [Tepidimonas ignava]|uniref:hypothetical protein n=1 Tax=Tepidimonas ignava TaxID=114249 RepID=UPI001C8F3A14|nr:hypothetical protein [Tepidimonas ignava]
MRQQLAGGDQAFVEGLDDGVAATGGQCWRVQHAAREQVRLLDCRHAARCRSRLRAAFLRFVAPGSPPQGSF